MPLEQLSFLGEPVKIPIGTSLKPLPYPDEFDGISDSYPIESEDLDAIIEWAENGYTYSGPPAAINVLVEMGYDPKDPRFNLQAALNEGLVTPNEWRNFYSPNINSVFPADEQKEFFLKMLCNLNEGFFEAWEITLLESLYLIYTMTASKFQDFLESTIEIVTVTIDGSENLPIQYIREYETARLKITYDQIDKVQLYQTLNWWYFESGVKNEHPVAGQDM